MTEMIARHGLGLLLDASLRSLPLLTFAGIALFCLRRSSAAARHLVLLLTLTALLLLPPLSSALPGWRVALLPHHVPVLPPMAGMPPPKTDAVPMSAPDAGGLPSLPSPNTPSVSAPLPSAGASRMASTPWALYGFVLWLCGAIAVSAPVVAGLVCVHRLGRRSTPIAACPAIGLMAELRRELGIRRAVMLRQNERDDVSPMPMTWGWLRPVVLLPVAAKDWPEERLRVVLLHEFAHVRRNDWLWQMLAHLTCTLYWFHPGVWLMARGLRAESERACDDQVLSAGISAQAYSRHLLSVVRLLSTENRGPLLALPMAEISQLESRMRHVLDSERSRQMVSRRKGLIGMVLLMGLLLPLAALRPVSGLQQSPPQPAPVVVQKPFTVVIDAGHGGQDTGAVGLDGTREKDLNLAIALKLRDTLTKDGVHVIMTRTGDTFLSVMARPAFVAANHAQYFVSVHCDNQGTAGSHSGLTAYYHGTSLIDKRLAADVLGHVALNVVSPVRNVVSDTTRFPRGFGVLRGSPVPAMMIECGFMNNARDLKAMRQPETQQQIANGIATGLEDFAAQQAQTEPSAAVPAAHADPAAVVLINRMYAASAALKSFSCTLNSEVTGIAVGSGKPYRFSESHETIALQKPGRIAMERKDSVGEARAIADGKNLYVTTTDTTGRRQALQARYLKLGIEPDVPNRLPLLSRYGNIPQYIPYQDFVPDAILGMQVRPAENYNWKMGRPGVVSGEIVDTVTLLVDKAIDRYDSLTLAISRRDHLLRQVSETQKWAHQPLFSRIETYTRIRRNPALPVSLFAFTPPPSGVPVATAEELYRKH